jgi:hypothetical protein
MIVKQSLFAGCDESGPHIHILRAGYSNDHLIKESSVSPPQLDHVKHLMKELPKNDGVLYTLVSAMGAGEYWGSNSNADFFGEERLLHVPPGWDDFPHDQQKVVGRNWEWGYPTFYNARAYAHHQNRDPNRAFGTIDYAMWDSYMKRVLLVVGFDRKQAEQFGASGVIDRVENGEHPSVSMGARVPYDLCSYCADWSRITLNPQIDLAEHRRKPIRGLSATEHEYCDHLRNQLNRILPDGRKVMMLNMHPRFFDLSVVFIGADKTSYILAKLAGACPIRLGKKACAKGCYDCSIPSSHVHEVWSRGKVASPTQALTKTAQSTGRGQWSGYVDDPMGSGPDVDFEDQAKEEARVNAILKRSRKRFANVIKTGEIPKDAEITKRVRSNFRGSLPKVVAKEPDLPVDDLDKHTLPDILGSTGAMGIVVKPHEFQRMFIRRLGRPELADELDQKGLVFRSSTSPNDMRLGSIQKDIVGKVLPLIRARSAMTPSIGRRVVIDAGGSPECDYFRMQADKGVPDLELIKAFLRYLGARQVAEKKRVQIEGPLLDKIGSAYCGYRRDLIYKVAGLIKQAAYVHPQIIHTLLADDLDPKGLVKAGGDVMESMLGMLSTMYLNEAYLDSPLSKYIVGHCEPAGLLKAGDLAKLGGVA